MDYGKINDSAVPHVSTITTDFNIEYVSYRNTLIMECSFIILVLPFLGMWIYFSTKSRKTKKSEQEQKNKHHHSGGQNNAEVMSNMHSIAEEPQQQNKIQPQSYQLQNTKTKDNDKAWKRLQLIDRRLCYIVSFFVAHLVCINSFDTNTLSIVSFFLTFLIYILFNVARPKKTLILIGMYIVPVFISCFSFWLGKHKLGEHKGI